VRDAVAGIRYLTEKAASAGAACAELGGKLQQGGASAEVNGCPDVGRANDHRTAAHCAAGGANATLPGPPEQAENGTHDEKCENDDDRLEWIHDPDATRGFCEARVYDASLRGRSVIVSRA
jgi:hypothetical protein